ncbi:hypothetical protein [Exiguobacterium sp. PvP048]|uniref:hypothetical protein n=1 Tax=unclassified Exiguobacterium TaxID=2644629 RepID=UPI000039D4C2
MLALLCLMMSIIATYLLNYWAYTAARMIIGLGGSMVVVFLSCSTYLIFSFFLPETKPKQSVPASKKTA